ncbi:MAG: PD-(D/E)XK nuclease family protein [Janthinobacterium lividum]
MLDVALYTTVVDAIADFDTTRRRHRRQCLVELIPAIAQHAAISRERNRLESGGLNVFRFFSPGETTHSRLLAYFLDPQGQHGQGTLFLAEFLRLLGISEPDSGAAHWTVTAETGRVDVLIRRAHPHTVVVVENKSNYAIDQPNQLYRYWHQEIHLKQLARHRPAAEIDRPPESHYRLVYLAPAAWKKPEAQSLRRPEAWKEWGAHLPAVVPMTVEQHLFRDFVVCWLEKAIAQLPPSNHRLREFTRQYIQFWQAS